MERLTQTRFFGLVCVQQEPPDPRLLQAAWCDFAQSVVDTIFSEEPFVQRHNTIAFTLAEITVLHEKNTVFQNGEYDAETLRGFIGKAKLLLETQFNLLKLSLEHPNALILHSTDKFVSPFSWAKAYTKQDLTTLISGLHEMKAIDDMTTGTTATYQALVSGFECFLNIKMPQAHKKRGEAVNRKFKAVEFLERMIRALIGRSQR